MSNMSAGIVAKRQCSVMRTLSGLKNAQKLVSVMVVVLGTLIVNIQSASAQSYHISHADYEQYKRAVADCRTNPASHSCDVVKYLRSTHQSCETQLNLCRGIDSVECKNLIANVSSCTADAIFHANGGGWDSYKFHLFNGSAGTYFYNENVLVRQMVQKSKSNLRKHFSTKEIAAGILGGSIKMTKSILGFRSDDQLMKNTGNVAVATVLSKEYHQDMLKREADIYRNMDAYKWGENVGESLTSLVMLLMVLFLIIRAANPISILYGKIREMKV